MSAAAVGLLDASVFIACESERPVGELPGRVAISVVTVGELQLGVLAAVDAPMRARRAAALGLRAGPIRFRSAKL
jgi:predicted nucleic acid-binding protein